MYSCSQVGGCSQRCFTSIVGCTSVSEHCSEAPLAKLCELPFFTGLFVLNSDPILKFAVREYSSWPVFAYIRCRRRAGNKHFKFRVSEHKCACISFLTHVLHSHYIIGNTTSSGTRASLEVECNIAVYSFLGPSFSVLWAVLVYKMRMSSCLHVG